MTGPFVSLTNKLTGRTVLINFALIEGIVDKGSDGTMLIPTMPETPSGDDNSWHITETIQVVHRCLEAALEKEAVRGR